MKALVKEKPEPGLSLLDIEQPQVQRADDVLFNVSYCAICVGETKLVTVSLPGLEFTRKEMTIAGSRASANCFPEALQLLASGAITYPQVATHFSMWDSPEVFEDLAENPDKVHKGALIVEGKE